MTNEKTDEKLIFIHHPIRQIIWNHLARYCCLSDGRQYQHLISVIHLLNNIVGQQEIKNHYGESYSKINNILKEFEKATNNITAFVSIVNQKDYRDTNFYNQKLRLYFSSLQKLPLIHQEVLEVFVFLFNKTTLKNESIPSSYIAQASAELILK